MWRGLNRLGKHVIADFFGCDFYQLEDLKSVLEILKNGVLKSGATILDYSIKKFEPQGGTIVIVLAESHLSFHSYPEYGVAMIDIFTCGDKDPVVSFEYIKTKIKHEKCNFSIVNRGNLDGIY